MSCKESHLNVAGSAEALGSKASVKCNANNSLKLCLAICLMYIYTYVDYGLIYITYIYIYIYIYILFIYSSLDLNQSGSKLREHDSFKNKKNESKSSKRAVLFVGWRYWHWQLLCRPGKMGTSFNFALYEKKTGLKKGPLGSKKCC